MDLVLPAESRRQGVLACELGRPLVAGADQLQAPEGLVNGVLQRFRLTE